MAGLDSNTKLLLHCDGSDESTTFTDVSDSSHTVTANGDAQVDTSVKKFGTGSLLLDGTGDYLTVPDSTDWDIFGSDEDNWTVDFWTRPSDFIGHGYFLSQQSDSTHYWYIWHHSSGTIGFGYNDGTNSASSQSTAVLSTDTWQHVAFVKNGTNYAMYINGTQVNYLSSSYTSTITSSLYIGDSYDSGLLYSGYMDEIRIQKSNAFNVTVASSDPTGDWMDNTGSNLGTITVPTASYSKDVTINKISGISISSISKINKVTKASIKSFSGIDL